METLWSIKLELSLPAILDVPDKLLPLITDFNSYRYFLIDGGRASGKTQTIARFIAYLCEQKSLRVVCGRETQNSIEESVYTVFADLKRDFNLNFDISASKIDHRVTKSAIRFRGFREQGATNIKGLEGVDILWVDESQAISKQTMDIIIPTIRKENAKIIWSMNRHIEHDPVYVAMKGRPDCLCIHIDYVDNPFCPKAMIAEADTCKAQSIEDYNHIWLGKPLIAGSDHLLTTEEVYGSPDFNFFNSGVNKRILAVDVARFGDDETVFMVIESQNVRDWQIVYCDNWRDKSTMETVGKTIDISRRFGCDLVVVDDTGVGGGVVDRLAELRTNVMPFIGAGKPLNELYSNVRAEAYFLLKEMFHDRRIKILKDKILQDQLLSVRFKYASNGKKAMISKDDMKKDGLKSPDRADCLSMALYGIDSVLNESKFSGIENNTYQMVEAF